MKTEKRLTGDEDIFVTLARLERKMHERLANKTIETTFKKLAEAQAHADERMKALFEMQRRNDKS